MGVWNLCAVEKSLDGEVDESLLGGMFVRMDEVMVVKTVWQSELHGRQSYKWMY